MAWLHAEYNASGQTGVVVTELWTTEAYKTETGFLERPKLLI